MTQKESIKFFLIEIEKDTSKKVNNRMKVFKSKKIGLCMIVKNESKIIERCLNSVKPLIDYVCIVDTGSTDDTIDVINNWMKSNDIEGKVIFEPWKNFAYNRSFAMEKIREKKYIEYVLMIDADEILTYEEGLDFSKIKENLSFDLYNMNCKLGGVEYLRTSITKNKKPYFYKGVVHEYLECKEPIETRETIKGICNIPLQDSARNQNIEKYQHDAKAIQDALETETDPFLVSRYTFYLAQSYRDSLEKEKAISHVANILARTFEEVLDIYDAFGSENAPDRFLHVIYWLGKLAIEEMIDNNKRTITFSPVLRERLGHHIHGEIWATQIKDVLKKNDLLERPIHIISANMHSVMNSIFATNVLKTKFKDKSDFFIYEELSKSGANDLRNKVEEVALKSGMISVLDESGTNIDVQIFDTAKIDFSKTSFSKAKVGVQKPVLIVMDYAFGEQAYETIDELLKPYKEGKSKVTFLNVESVSIMGKAGILQGGKGDIMIPSAHINEGTGDNYPFENELTVSMFNGQS